MTRADDRVPAFLAHPTSNLFEMKSLDWRAHKAARIGAVSEEVVTQVLQRLQTLLARGS